MAYESKFASFIRRGGSGSFDLKLADLGGMQRKFVVSPGNLVGSIADNALADGLADLNQYLPLELSANIKGLDFSDIKAELDIVVTARITEIGLPIDANDPIIKDAIQHAASEVSARLQRAGMGLTEFIWRSRDDGRVRPEHQAHDDQHFLWATPPDDGTPGEAYGCRCSAEPVFVLEDLPEGATCERLTAEKMRVVFPNAPDAQLKALADAIDPVITKGKLENPERLAHFFGQAGIEMGGQAILEENLHYPASRLIVKFSYFAQHPDEAETYGKTDQHPSDPEAIANRAYANRNGNGDVESGDGWRYRGRGMFQTTGRGNYEQLTAAHREVFDEFVDFFHCPDLVAGAKYAARAAAILWLGNGFAEIADQGTTSEVTDQITAIINLRTNNYSERSTLVSRLAGAGIFTDVCQFSVTQPTFDLP